MEKVPYILYIDDDEDDCMLVQDAINRTKFNILLTYIDSGDKAVEFISNAINNNELPRVIILDINMPGMGGRSTLLELKKILPSQFPILFLTTTPRNNDISFGEKNGATLFAKPTSIAGYNDLINTIMNVFF